MSEWMNKWKDELKEGWIKEGWIKERMNKRKERWIKGWMNE